MFIEYTNICILILGGQDKSNNQIKIKNNRKVPDLSDTMSDSGKYDGGSMHYVRQQRSHNRLQDEEPKTNIQKTSDKKNVNLTSAYKFTQTPHLKIPY